MVHAKHVPISIFAIVAIVGIAILLLSVDYFPAPAPFAVTIVGKAFSTEGSNTVIVNLEIGEYLSNEVNALTESQINSLSSGTIHGNGGSTSYTQSIRFSDPGVFNGGHVVFGTSESNQVSDFLQFDDALFKYQIEFGSGLRSEVKDGKLPDIEGENINLLGDTYSIVDTSADTTSKRVSIRMFGGFGNIELTDGNYADDAYYEGVQINGRNVNAKVKIKATDVGSQLTIYSIQYLVEADSALGGEVQVLPLHCSREYLQYPTALLSPNFDICYKGLSGQSVGTSKSSISGNEVRVTPLGNDEYAMIASNTHGQLYKIPLAQNPGMYGNKGRNFIFVEAGAPGAPNIPLDTYFLVNSKNDVNGVSNVLLYNSIDTTNHVVSFTDLAGGSRSVSYDAATNEGQLLVGDGTYKFVIGAGNALAMDQTNDGGITGAEARFVFAGGSRVDFGPGFVITITTPSKLFQDPVGDENTNFNILFGGDIELFVPSPQAPIFNLHGTDDGHEQGLTKYGILFDWDQSTHSDRLNLVIPGGYSGGTKGGSVGNVYITFERAKLMKKSDVPAPPPKCGDKLITKPEFCDPPGSLCAGPGAFDRGVCAKDCMSCIAPPKAVCGNKLLEKGEECEAAADCPQGFDCRGCKCAPLPQAVCGNKILEPNEQCEANADCPLGQSCANCRCALPQNPNCARVGKCRVWGGCGVGGDSIMIDGLSQGCMDPWKAASDGIPYCGSFPIARQSLACNYMSHDTKSVCVCPPPPTLELPTPIEQISWLDKLRVWFRNLFAGPSATPDIQLPSGAVGANCKTPAPCRYWDASCGQGYEPLYVDGQFKQCVDTYQAAAKGIGYCGHKPLGQESAYCNYMSSDPREKLPCVCA